jgi:Type I site-specific restriction-modification system, R (restriction) subunit and related helicases
MNAANQRGVDLGLNDDEVAFYDALAQNNSAIQVMGKDNLKVIATNLLPGYAKASPSTGRFAKALAEDQSSG